MTFKKNFDLITKTLLLAAVLFAAVEGSLFFVFVLPTLENPFAEVGNFAIMYIFGPAISLGLLTGWFAFYKITNITWLRLPMAIIAAGLGTTGTTYLIVAAINLIVHGT